MNMKNLTKKLYALGLVLLLALALTVPVSADAPAPAEDGAPAVAETQDNTVGWKAIAAGIAVGVAAAGGALGMGIATAKAAESIARQPEAEGKVRTTLMLGLVFIETALIYALLVVILIIFVL